MPFGYIFVVWVALINGMQPMTAPESYALRIGLIRVDYAFQLDGWRPAAGIGYCQPATECTLGFDFDPVRITLQLGSGNDESTIRVSCEKLDEGCFFRTEQDVLRYHAIGSRLELDLISQPPRDLAFRPVKTIGKIWLRLAPLAKRIKAGAL